MIKMCNEVHTCWANYTLGGHDCILTSKVIAQFIMNEIQSEPHYKKLLKYLVAL